MQKQSLLKTLSHIVPVSDAQTTWLRIHRPSVAFLIAVLSGPWRLPRRQAVQAHAIQVLGKRDLSELTTKEIRAISPLDWQSKLMQSYVRYFKTVKDTKAKHSLLFQHPKHKRKSRPGFDNVFDLRYVKTEHKEMLRWFLDPFRCYKGIPYILREKEFEALFHKLPKVLGLFVRDYLYLEIIPQDRHVRAELKRLGLPTRHEVLLKLFHDNKLKARCYARAFFLNKASNPKHPPTRRL
jgi:hypothetical protein